MTNNYTFSIGNIVINFGVIAEVLAVDPIRGLLLKEVSTLTHKGCGKWYANPDLCKPYEAQVESNINGLVIFD